MAIEKTGQKGQETQAKTRVLLALWTLEADKTEVKKGDLTERLKRKNEKAGDYQGILDQLQTEGAISLTKNKVTLSEKGLQMLDTNLNSPNFEFDSQIGAKTANALLRWMRERGTSTNGNAAAVSGKGGESAIASYDQFKQLALDVYDRLNRDYNLDNLVPIYRIRREIGDRVSRSQFNEWMLEMQEKDIVQLQGGSVEDSAPDKIEDSITTKVSGLRCYAKRLIP